MKVQGVFTEAEGEIYSNRVLCNFSYPNHVNETQMMNEDVSQFYRDVILSGVADSGRWDNFYDFNGLLPLNPSQTSQRYEPHYRRANSAQEGTYPNNNYSSERLHEAANLAFALSFSEVDYEIAGISKPSNTIAKELARAVWKEIVAMANDDKLDASNGGANRELGEPGRNNPSYGQTIRFDHTPQTAKSNRVGIQRGEPFYISAMKIVKVLHSYGLIKEIIKDESDFTQNEEFVNYWILDWTRWAYAQYNRFFVNSFGTNWRAFDGNFSPTQSFAGSGIDQAYTYFDGDGNGVNRVTEAQRFTLNNRELIYPLLVKTYATYFDDKDLEAWAYDVFKVYVALGIYPDGTHHEMYRLGSNSITNNFPMVYPELSSAILLAWARTHEVGVKNGSLSDADKYWSYTSSMGSDELYRSPWETPTSGGSKGLELVLENIAGYLKGEDEGGVVGNRYNQNGILIDNRDQTMTAIYAMANRFYNNQLFEDIIERNGYPTYRPTSLAGLPTEAGAGWGLYLAMGGETAILPANQNSNSECGNIAFPDSDSSDDNDDDSNEDGENTENDTLSEEEVNQQYAIVAENPVRESTIRIRKQNADCVNLKIFDLTAKLLFLENRCGENIDLDVSFLPRNNLYFLQLLNLEHNQTFKLLF
ncbi:hypothetical protein [Croceivirga thetidis]|uniref:Secretion system C-terminal sorting domain-containing protein n=1 Tax=Croceivirga thetidis TaxID=2721623 RepID=A0ABX1GTJ2_9FLAO|nr:hypothetical protein [Croceivirga thetidis]NKI32037.1 hypothetical protein [Croceivirga thetidis]